jgi:hypothetical protein
MCMYNQVYTLSMKFEWDDNKNRAKFLSYQSWRELLRMCLEMPQKMLRIIWIEAIILVN